VQNGSRQHNFNDNTCNNVTDYSNLLPYEGAIMKDLGKNYYCKNLCLGPCNNCSFNYIGAWETRNINQVYQAGSDGFVQIILNSVPGPGNTLVQGFSDSTSNPTTQRVNLSGRVTAASTATMPVRQGDNWKVTLSNAQVFLFWVPLQNLNNFLSNS